MPNPFYAASSAPRVAVIGAGPCGLTAVKNLLQQGLTQTVCFEERDVIGGLWAYSAEPSIRSVHDSTCTITSKNLSSFDDFPMPWGYPDYPSHRQVLSYLNDYADNFGLRPFIRHQTSVVGIVHAPDGKWRIATNSAGEVREEIFDFVLVCTGHHRIPDIPENVGSWSGESVHSSGYRTATPYTDKSVLVVGGGNSACDIAVDVSRVAARTAISLRRGYHIVPRWILGKPIDVKLGHLKRGMPWFVHDWIAELAILLVNGRYHDYGLETPKARLMQVHPTINSYILPKIREGQILPRPGIAGCDGHRISFSNGWAEEFDAIIWATGYKTTLLDCGLPSLRSWQNGAPPLYLKMMPEDTETLFYIGFFQPHACIWPLADLQSRIAALQISKRLSRPFRMKQRIREEQGRRRRFEGANRHDIQVDGHDFKRRLLAELARSTHS